MEGVPLEGVVEGVSIDGFSGVAEPGDESRLVRKAPLRLLRYRVRGLKVKPKSPLIRMAEMRKGSLRGRNLLKPEVKGRGRGLLSASGRGEKEGRRGKQGNSLGEEEQGSCGKSESGLVVEDCEMAGLSDTGKHRGDQEGVLMEVRREGEMGMEQEKGQVPSNSVVVNTGYKQALQKDLPLSGFDEDLVLDLIVPQPLQEMDFVAAWGKEAGDFQEDGVDGYIGGGDKISEEDFPPLSKDTISSAKANGKGKAIPERDRDSLRSNNSSEFVKPPVVLNEGLKDRSKEGGKAGQGARQMAISGMGVRTTEHPG